MANAWEGWTIEVDRVCYYEPGDAYRERSGVEGIVFYLLLRACTERPCAHVCDTHPGMEHRYLSQPFARDGPRKYKDASEEEKANPDRANVWGFDGNRAAPSLTPSYFFKGHSAGEGKYPDWPSVHSYFTAGRLVDHGVEARIVPNEEHRACASSKWAE